jgi:hypothetical protein
MKTKINDDCSMRMMFVKYCSGLLWWMDEIEHELVLLNDNKRIKREMKIIKEIYQFLVFSIEKDRE